MLLDKPTECLSAWNGGDMHAKCRQLLERSLYLSVFTTVKPAFSFCKCSKKKKKTITVLFFHTMCVIFFLNCFNN